MVIQSPGRKYQGNENTFNFLCLRARICTVLHRGVTEAIRIKDTGAAQADIADIISF